jgi:hypothetical protein
MSIYKFTNDINVFHFVLLVLGLSSICHHSRLDRWYINDSIRTADYLSVIATALTGLFFFEQPYVLLAWVGVLLYSVVVFAMIAKEAIHRRVIPVAHSTTHIALLFFLVYFDVRNAKTCH